MNIEAYLSRIGQLGRPPATIAALRDLQRAHLYSVPFENLDIHLGRPIRLDEASLFDKIVNHRRGGFCYELNGLFAQLLSALGYTVQLLNARGVNDDGAYSREFDHLALMVTSPEDPTIPWLVDVGWGNGPLEPLRLEANIDQISGGVTYRLTEAGEYLVLTEFTADGRWVKHYAFTLQTHQLPEYAAACRFQETSPESYFTKKRLCTLYLPDGRVTLSELCLITTHGGQRQERSLSGEDEFRRVLKETFKMEL